MTKQLNILHIGKYYPPYHGGIENFLRDLAEAQVERGHRVTVLCHHHERVFKTTREVRNRVDVIRARNLGEVAYAPLSPGFTGEVRRLQRACPPDVIHVHLPNLSALFLSFTAKLPPVVIHWHSDVVSAPGMTLLRFLYPPYRLLEKKLLKRAWKIIVTSRHYLETSIPLSPYVEKCRVVPLGLDPQRMETPSTVKEADGDHHRRNRAPNFYKNQDAGPDDRHAIRTPKRPGKKESWWPHLSDAQCLAVAVGRFTIYKGFDLLLRAAALVPSVTVVIVGDGPLRANIISLRRELNVERNVLLPGMLSDRELHLLLAACDMVIVPSIERTEAFGLVLLEAMSYAKPLITTKVPGSGMNMVNIHEKTGLIVPPGDVTSLAKAIDTLCTNSSLREKLGNIARQRLEEEFTISSVANQIDMVYSES